MIQLWLIAHLLVAGYCAAKNKTEHLCTARNKTSGLSEVHNPVLGRALAQRPVDVVCFGKVNEDTVYFQTCFQR